MNPIRDDRYEEMAATFQCLQIDLLNKTLRAHGVDDAGTRRKICEEYAFNIGALLDQQWFESEGKKLAPSLVFIDIASCKDFDRNIPGDVYWCSDLFSFEEYTMGNVSCYFEDNAETVPDLVSGGMDDLPE